MHAAAAACMMPLGTRDVHDSMAMHSAGYAVLCTALRVS
jgi:hypothetical protein